MPWEPSLHVKGVVSLTHPHSGMRGCTARYGKRSDSRKHHIAIQWCWRPQNPQNNKHSRSLMERDSLSKGMKSKVSISKLRQWLCTVSAWQVYGSDHNTSITHTLVRCLPCVIDHLQWIRIYEHNLYPFQRYDLSMTHITSLISSTEWVTAWRMIETFERNNAILSLFDEKPKRVIPQQLTEERPSISHG